MDVSGLYYTDGQCCEEISKDSDGNPYSITTNGQEFLWINRYPHGDWQHFFFQGAFSTPTSSWQPKSTYINRPKPVVQNTRPPAPGVDVSPEKFGSALEALRSAYEAHGAWIQYGSQGIVEVSMAVFTGGTSTEIRLAVRETRQYALTAIEDGWDPVMKRRFFEPQGYQWLNSGDVWKYGVTKNFIRRYSMKYLEKTGVQYEWQFCGTKTEAKYQEIKKIGRYFEEHNFFPPGNKVRY